MDNRTTSADNQSQKEKRPRQEAEEATAGSAPPSRGTATEPRTTSGGTAQRPRIDNAAFQESRREVVEELEYVTNAFTDQLVALIRMKKWRKATEKLKEILDLDPANRRPPLFWPPAMWADEDTCIHCNQERYPPPY